MKTALENREKVSRVSLGAPGAALFALVALMILLAGPLGSAAAKSPQADAQPQTSAQDSTDQTVPRPPASVPAPLAEPAHPSRFLTNSYVGLQFGSINYAFNESQLQPGFHAQSVSTPHFAVRVVLFGHEFNKYFSAQIAEFRPVLWVSYKDVNGGKSGTVLMNVASITGVGHLPLGKRWSLFGEGGLGVVTRTGFQTLDVQALNDSNYPTFLFGGGVDYRLNEHWTLLTGVTVAAGRAADKQPATVLFSSGFNYTLRRVPAEPSGTDAEKTPLWPKNIVEFGVATDAAGFGANNFFANTLHIFWPGKILVANGFSVNYQRNLFHTRRWFALDWGADVSTWKSKLNGERFVTASIYPVARFPLIRSNPVEFYVDYSFAGPSFISRTTIDDLEAGKGFTFQDFMGAGIYLGRERKLTAELRIQHYSNGNIFPRNPGVTIPMGIYVGTSF